MQETAVKIQQKTHSMRRRFFARFSKTWRISSAVIGFDESFDSWKGKRTLGVRNTGLLMGLAFAQHQVHSRGSFTFNKWIYSSSRGSISIQYYQKAGGRDELW